MKIAIAIVEDDPEISGSLFYILSEHLGKESISKYSSGEQFISSLQTKQPDVVLMDIQLADISGIDLIKALKNNPQTRRIPIIVITAFAMKNEVVRISESGCDLYLSKPVSIDNFFFSIEKFISNNNIV